MDVDVFTGVEVDVLVGVDVDVFVGVDVDVFVGVDVDVFTGVGVDVLVGVEVDVFVGVDVDVFVGVEVDPFVGEVVEPFVPDEGFFVPVLNRSSNLKSSSFFSFLFSFTGGVSSTGFGLSGCVLPEPFTVPESGVISSAGFSRTTSGRLGSGSTTGSGLGRSTRESTTPSVRSLMTGRGVAGMLRKPRS